MDKNVIQVTSKLTLTTAAISDFAAVASWFVPVISVLTKSQHSNKTNIQKQLRQWAGPKIDYPCSTEQLALQLNAAHYKSYVLVANTDTDTKNDTNTSTIGFGQIQLVKQRVHLARLAINPAKRGQGLGKRLISELIAQAQTQVKVKEASLFVDHENTAAIACYERYGFVQSATPEGINPLAECRFMTLRC